jgi:hypothetical protein
MDDAQFDAFLTQFPTYSHMIYMFLAKREVMTGRY